MKYLSMIHLYIKSMLCEIFIFFGGEYIYIYENDKIYERKNRITSTKNVIRWQ